MVDIVPRVDTCTLIRLKEEMLRWRVNHPLGFYARPAVELENKVAASHRIVCPDVPSQIFGEDHSYNLFVWHCGIPGKSNSRMRDFYFDLTLTFSIEYPKQPPEIEFHHPVLKEIPLLKKVYECPYLKENRKWSAILTIERILCGIQDILHRHKFMDPPVNQIGLYARHQNTQLPFYPFTLGWYYPQGTFFMTGTHTAFSRSNQNNEEE